jgi:hypothetical protein
MASKVSLESTLTNLIDSLESTLQVLKQDAQAELKDTLHNHDRIPDKNIARIASKAVNLLHETEQLLEPGSLVLADHFLGISSFPGEIHRIHQPSGFLSSKCLNAAVELNIPDILRNGPKLLSDLAVESEARPDRLRQVLRVLYNNGIFAYDASTDMFSNNSTSELLLSDHWTQWRNWVDLYGNEFYDMAKGIPAACRKDATRMPAQIFFDTDLDMFTYFKEQGWVPRLHKTLSGGAAAQAPGILADYPWEEISDCTFLDVGGGGGGLVALVLREHKEMRSGILDRPEVITQNLESFHGLSGQFRDIGDRVPKENLIVGDFLKDVPPFEIYTMKWCLHDWDDSKALKAMVNIRRAVLKGPKSRLVIFESLLTDGRMGRLSRYGDIIMWMSANGQERSETQWRHLATLTGWKVKEIYTLRNAWPCAIELIPDWTWKVEQTEDNLSQDAVVSHNISNEAVEGKSLAPAASNETNLDNSEVTTSNVASHAGATYSTTMSFLEPWGLKTENPFIRVQPAEGFDYMNFKWHDYPIKVTDARPRKESFHIDKHGFAFINDPDEMSPSLIQELRANDKAAIKKQYYPRIETLIKKATGAARVIIFDDTVRKQNPEMGPKENPNGREQPATMVSPSRDCTPILNIRLP